MHSNNYPSPKKKWQQWYLIQYSLIGTLVCGLPNSKMFESAKWVMMMMMLLLLLLSLFSGEELKKLKKKEGESLILASLQNEIPALPSCQCKPPCCTLSFLSHDKRETLHYQLLHWNLDMITIIIMLHNHVIYTNHYINTCMHFDGTWHIVMHISTLHVFRQQQPL